jgi:hypothetical protein
MDGCEGEIGLEGVYGVMRGAVGFRYNLKFPQRLELAIAWKNNGAA